MKVYKNLSQALKDWENVQYLMVTILEEEMPPQLCSFPELKELSLKAPHSNGNLSGLFNLPKLENLKILETPLKHLYLPLGHSLSPLRSLTLKDCGLEELPEEIAVLGQLRELNLSGNRLKALPYSFVDLYQLKRLNLDNNQFTTFPDGITRMLNLTHLSIDNNQFSSEEKARIQRDFSLWPL